MYVDLNNIDLTGNDPNFSRTYQVAVFKSGQVIKFGEPIFGEDLKVYRISGNTADELVAGSDYTIPRDPSDYVDYDGISAAKVRASLSGDTFEKNLVNAITMSQEYNGEYRIAIEAHALYRRSSDYTAIGEGPEYSRAFGASVVERLNNLENTLNPVSRITSTEIGNVAPLEEDLTARAGTNYIVGEKHKIDVPNNIYVIRPLYGDFYDDDDVVVEFEGVESMTITDAFIGKTIIVDGNDIELTGSNIYNYTDKVYEVRIPKRTLLRNEDYIVRGIDRAKTRIALVSSGVYSNIILTKKFRGDVVINYHAFGGNVSIKDIYTIKDTLMNLVMSISGNQFITVESLTNLPKIVNIIDRIERLEDLFHVHTPTAIPYEYAFDAGEGVAKWVDVAQLFNSGYSEEGTIPEVLTETFALINESLGYKATFDINYDLNHNSCQIVNTKIASCKLDAVGYEYFNDRRTPMFRIVYDKTDTSKGLVLQMAIISGVEGSNLWQIYSVKANESLWMIIDKDGAYREDASLVTKLPNGSAWNQTIDGMTKTNVAVLSDPYTIFAGSVDMGFIDDLSYREGIVYDNEANGTNFEDEPGEVELEGLVVNPCCDKAVLVPNRIRGFKFTIFDRYEGKYINAFTNNISGNDSVHGDVVYFDADMCHISARVYLDNGNPKLVIKTNTGSNSLESKRFDLRQVDVLFTEREG